MKTPVSWVGNKTSILHILYALFPLKYERYIEPFGGSGAVLLGKAVPDKFEVYNDYNRNLVTLFRCMRDRPISLIRELGFLNLHSRDDFVFLKKFFEREEFTDEFLSEEHELTTIMLPEASVEELMTLRKRNMDDHDIRRAAMFLKLIRYSYASGCDSYSCKPFSIRSLFGLIQNVTKRLDGVVIENQDFETLIKHYDRPESFFYCDPPYFASEYIYECEFGWEDHVRLRDTLAQAKGKWLVSYNDCPEIRKLYDGYEMFDFTRTHSMVQRYESGREFAELLIGNYDLYERVDSKPRQLTLTEMLGGEETDRKEALRKSIMLKEKR